MHTEKRQNKVGFQSGHGSLGASRCLPVADIGKLAPMCPSVSPPREGQIVTVGLAKCHRTHMLLTKECPSCLKPGKIFPHKVITWHRLCWILISQEGSVPGPRRPVLPRPSGAQKTTQETAFTHGHLWPPLLLMTASSGDPPNTAVSFWRPGPAPSSHLPHHPRVPRLPGIGPTPCPCLWKLSF